MQPSATLARPRARAIPVLGYLRRNNRGWLLLGYAILFLAAVWTLLPVYWMVITALKSDADMYSVQHALWPSQFTLVHFRDTFLHSAFPIFLRNSCIVACITAAVSTLVAAMAGYALTRLDFTGRKTIARLLIYCYLAPGTVLFIPIFVMMVHLHLTNSLQGLALTYLTFSVPFSTWMLMGYLRTIPAELEEAALVDGATRWVALWRVILPLAAPAVVVVAVFSFTLSWNEFLYALVLVQNQGVMTAPVGLAFMQTGDVFFWGQIMAAATVMTIPPLLLYLFGQRWVISGWTLGAVKS